MLSDQQRQRPEMGRRPEEDDREQVPGREAANLVGDGRPADEWGDRACRASDYDVARSRAFEPQRVDEDVAEQAHQGEDTGQQVDEEHEHGAGDHSQGDAELQGIAWLDDAGGDRAPRGPPHQRVNVAVHVVIDGAGAAGHQGTAEQRCHECCQVR